MRVEYNVKMHVIAVDLLFFFVVVDLIAKALKMKIINYARSFAQNLGNCRSRGSSLRFAGGALPAGGRYVLLGGKYVFVGGK